MQKHWSAHGSLFLFVRTHQQLEYYLRLQDARLAANQSLAANQNPSANHGAAGCQASTDTSNVIEIHPLARVKF